MKYEETINISASPEKIYSVYADIPNWPKWDSGTLSASINGEFETGSKGKLKPEGEPETAYTLLDVIKNKSFIVECKMPLCKMHFIHELELVDNGTNVTNRVLFYGLLAPVFSRLIGSKIESGMQVSLKELKAYVE